ncbi:hypothetical protein GBA52_028467 [Prunus armeniaca]|nr:hypothetical protein GBA52_028467 [Prunus armeniaca]
MDDKLEEVLESLQDEKLLTKRLLLKLFSRSWIHFAYFPCPHCSIDEEAVHLGDTTRREWHLVLIIFKSF